MTREMGLLWKSLVDGNPDGVLAFDAEFRYTVWNAAMERIAGIPAERVLGRVAWDVFPFLRAEGEDAYFAAALAGEVRQTPDRPFRVPESGREGFFRAEYAPVRDDEGRVIGGMAVVRDTTESRRAEEALRMQALVLDSMNEGVSIADEHGFIVYTNPAEDRMFGYERGELIGQHVTIQNTYAPEENRRIVAEVIDCLRSAGEWTGEWSNVRKDGTPFLTRARITALELPGKSYWVCVQEDITEERRVEAENARLMERIAMLATASQELSSSLDYERTLDTIAHLPVPSVADWCFVEVLQPDGGIELLTVGHSDPAMEEHARRTLRRYPVDPAAPYGTARVIRTGEPELMLDIPQGVLDAVARDAEHLEILRRIGFRSSIGVPLAVHGRVFGALTLVQAESGRRFAEADLPLIRDLAVRAAVAMENARLHRAAEESRALLDTLFQTAPVALAFVDRELRYRRMNDELARIDQVSPQDAIGKTIGEVVPDLAPTLEKLYRRVIDHGEEIRDMEIAGPRPGAPAETGHWLANYTPVRASDGQVLGVGLAALDITERKRAEEAQRFLADASAVLASSLSVEETLGHLTRMVVERLADACAIDLATPEGMLQRVAVTSRDPRKVEIVQELESRYPTPLESPAGHTTAFRTGEAQVYTGFPDELLRSASRDEDHFRLWKALEMESVLNVPLIARGRTLGVITLVSHTPGRGFGPADLELAGELGRRAAVAIDNVRLYEESQEANRAKSEFLAVMSHELRTPLTAITGYVELVADGIVGAVNDQQRGYLQRVTASAQHLLHMIEEILDFAKLEAGRHEVELEDVDARDLVRGAADMVEPSIRAQGIDFRVSVPDAPLPIRTDPDKARQILLNLLSNAVKFTDHGEIHLEARGDGERVLFVVADTGIGIAPQHLDSIFEPFRQAEQSKTRRVGGTGLGLSVVREIARLLGGDVEVSSTLHQGSTFKVSLPARPSE